MPLHHPKLIRPGALPALGTVALFLLGFALAAMCGGCVHRVGDPCNTGDGYCQDNGTALTCQSGKLVPYACSGQKGCTKDTTTRQISCDQSAGAIAGTPCFPAFEGQRQCRLDKTGLLQCVQGTWTAAFCPVGLTCHDDGTVSCK